GSAPNNELCVRSIRYDRPEFALVGSLGRHLLRSQCHVNDLGTHGLSPDKVRHISYLRYARGESNLCLRHRRPVLSPLSYGRTLLRLGLTMWRPRRESNPLLLLDRQMCITGTLRGQMNLNRASHVRWTIKGNQKRAFRSLCGSRVSASSLPRCLPPT